MKDFRFFVYIMTNAKNGTLYVGVSNDIVRRIYEHKNKTFPDSFTARYNCDKLVYFEEYKYVNDAIEREKKIKAGSRQKKDRVDRINKSAVARFIRPGIILDALIILCIFVIASKQQRRVAIQEI